MLHMNQSSGFLHCLGMYNLSTPIFSLLSPLLILVMPFVILKMKGTEVTIDQYVEHLKAVMKTTSLYKLISGFDTVSMQDKTTAIISLFIYFLQIYTNITTCMTYYKNIGSVYTFIQECKEHLQKTDVDTSDLTTYFAHLGGVIELASCVTEAQVQRFLLGRTKLFHQSGEIHFAEFCEFTCHVRLPPRG